MKLTRFGDYWIADLRIGRLQIRIGNWQRAVWWRKRSMDFVELLNSWRSARPTEG